MITPSATAMNKTAPDQRDTAPADAKGQMYAPGPYNIEDSFVITEDGHERFSAAPDSVVWDGTMTTQ
ncbi:MAG: hypothetical protein JKP98_07110 [Rhodobacteraceae bacterium]|nr:hypothetical protein [Paracoccaceae bacterium]